MAFFAPVKTNKRLRSVFKGRDVLFIGTKRKPLPLGQAMRVYNNTLNRIIKNIKNIPENVTHELAEIHDRETGKVLQEADLRDEARTALISHIDIKDKNSKKLQIVSMSDIGAFFEFGVKLHPVFASYSTIRGELVGDWMDEHGFPEGSQGFLVGKPGTILDKSNPLMFMGKGYEKSWKNAPRVTSKFIKQI